jgi:uncharacterized protein (TIGR00369 family)
MTDSALPPPPGFLPIPIDIGFIGVVGPLYMNVGGETLALGFRVEMRHCNPMQICHGGMMATFVDMLLPFAAFQQSGMSGRFLPTVHLEQDFLAPAPLGAWVEGRGELLRATKSLVFAQCVVTADGETCARASGIFKIGKETGGPGLMSLLSRMKD